MRTRNGIENAIAGILITKIEECNHNSKLTRTVTSDIIDFLRDEGNLIIPHIDKINIPMRLLGITIKNL